MEVKYKITHEDCWYIYLSGCIGIPGIRILVIAAGIVFSAEFIKTTFILSFRNDPALVKYILIVSLIVLIAYSLFKWVILTFMKPEILGEYTVEINEEGFKEKTQEKKQLITWNNIRDVLIDKKFIYIRINVKEVYPIPRKSFSNHH